MKLEQDAIIMAFYCRRKRYYYGSPTEYAAPKFQFTTVVLIDPNLAQMAKSERNQVYVFNQKFRITSYPSVLQADLLHNGLLTHVSYINALYFQGFSFFLWSRS